MSAYLSARDVATHLSIDPDVVYGWIHSRALAAINISADPNGRPTWRISRAALDNFLAARANRKPGPAPRRRRAVTPAVEYF